MKKQNINYYNKLKVAVCALSQVLLLSAFLFYGSLSEARELIPLAGSNNNQTKNAEKNIFNNSTAHKVGDITLRTNLFDSLAILKTEARLAGAISSFVFRGQEYINADDNGRELQSSIFLDEFGACLNPTEAGGAYDKGIKTSSKLLYATLKDRTIKTGVNMAYWLAPQQQFSKGQCGIHAGVNTAQNDTILSGYLLHKKVTVGVPDFPNVIDYQVAFDVPKKHNTAMFEVLTGYMPKKFNSFYQYDDRYDTFAVVNVDSMQSKYPIIVTTFDKNHAMSVYSQGLPQGNLGYAYVKHPNTSKFNCTYRAKNIDDGRYYFHAYVVFGTLDEVKTTLMRLVRRYPHTPYKITVKKEDSYPF